MFANRTLGCLILLVAAGIFAASASATLPPKLACDPVAEIREVAASAEIHGVGVERPAVYGFHSNVKDWPGLVDSLRRRKGPSARVWSFLSEKGQKLASEDGILQKFYDLENVTDPTRMARATDAVRLQAEIRDAFRKIADQPDFYQEEAFKGVAIEKEAKELISLGEKRTVHQTARMNWGLLKVAFPTCIPDLSSRFRTVQVQVREGNPVVLVLSSDMNCRWEIEVKRGGKVVGVLLCGNKAQEIAGVGEVPIVYRAAHAPDGKPVVGDNYFYGHDKLDLAFQQNFLPSVKTLLGKGFNSFQGENTPGPESEPYIIRPRMK